MLKKNVNLTSIAILVIASFTLHVFFLVAGKTFMSDWVFTHLPLHSSLEMMGSIIAFFVAVILIELEKYNEGTSFNIVIASAMIGMGILDGAHAAVHVGNNFVWLHSLATFVGGCLFACVWLPQAWFRKHIITFPLGVGITVSTIAALSIAFPQMIPAMVENLRFTPAAMFLNVLGGVGLFVAAVRFIQTYLKTDNTDDLLFCLHCILFGSAAIMFEQSQLWDLPWWGWHILRFLAYAVAVYFALKTRIAQMRVTYSQYDVIKQKNSELQEKESELVHANYELKRSNRDLDDFAYVASHDLKAPLRAVTHLASWIKEECYDSLSSDGRENMNLLTGRVKRMEHLLDGLLDYSRVGRQGQSTKQVQVRDLIDDIKKLNDFPASFNINLTSDIDCFYTKKVPLKTTLQNVISNAVKHHDKPNGNISIELRKKSQTLIAFEIKDDGPGIPRQAQDKVFNIFTTLKPRDEVESSGIGLAIVKRTVESLGGSIKLHSEGRGTTVSIQWPIDGEGACAQ